MSVRRRAAVGARRARVPRVRRLLTGPAPVYAMAGPVARPVRARGSGPTRRARSRQLLAGACVGAALAALGLVALRVDAIRLRYELAEAVREERALSEAQRELTARVRRLRDPQRLAEVARRHGFAAPTRVIELPSRGRR